MVNVEVEVPELAAASTAVTTTVWSPTVETLNGTVYGVEDPPSTV